MNITLYRLDFYTQNNIGQYLGIFTDPEEAINESSIHRDIVYHVSTPIIDADHYELTEFKVDIESLNQNDLQDKHEALRFWQDGNIIQTMYFEIED